MIFGARTLATMTVATFLTSASHAEEPKHAEPETAQTAQANGAPHRAHRMDHKGRPMHSYPRTELFLGYSYLRAAPTFADGNRLVHLNGGDASIAFNLTRSFGLVTDFSGFADSKIAVSGPGADPAGTFGSKGDAFTFLFGPRFSYRGHERIVPFFQVLAGGVHASEVTLTGCVGAACQVLPAQSSFALTAGGGLDLKVQKHLAIRLVQAEYLMTRLADANTGYSTTQNDIRLSAGLVFRFGGAREEHFHHPPMVSCSSDPATDGVLLHAHASDTDGDPLSYQWSASAGRVDGTGAEVRWVPADAKPGIYTVNVLVDNGHFGVADCNTNVHVDALPNHPPTLSCVADHTSVNAGDPLNITATAADSDQDPITMDWGTSGGRVVGSGTSVSIDTAGLPTGPITIQGHAFDGRGGVADCSLSVNVQGGLPAAVIVAEKRLALHSIYFPTAVPKVEDPNAGILASQQVTLQQLASDFKLYLTARPNAQLVFDGHADSRGSAAYNLALTQRRVDSAKRFLVNLGVPADKITIHSLGDQQELTADQVQAAVEHNPELSDEQRQKMLKNLQTIVLASNRRVDITLQGSDRPSSREYPFNAADSFTLLSQDQPGKKGHKGSKSSAGPK